MSIEAMKQALEALEELEEYQSRGVPFLSCDAAADALRQAITKAESVQPAAWVYPEGVEALKAGKPWIAYGFDGNGPNPDGVERIPLYLNDAVAPRVEPRASESGAGFESLPASPNAEQAQPVACKHEWFSTGAMEPGEMRCIHCGMWNDEVDTFPPHCEAGPEFCGQCLKESMPTYGSEEVRKLREVIESQARIIKLMEQDRGCPPHWPVVQHLLDEYGLQLIDIVATYKQALVEDEKATVWCDCGDSITQNSGAKCGNCLAAESSQPLTDDECDAIATALNEWALNADSYDYGLPIHNEGQLEKARAIIRAALNIKGEA
jgi:hypothetical protein